MSSQTTSVTQEFPQMLAPTSAQKCWEREEKEAGGLR